MNKSKTNQRSLLSENLTQFACCITICFILMAPVFYLLTKYFYAEDIMDIIEAVKQGQAIPPLDLERDIMVGMMIQFLFIFIAIALSLLFTMRFATKKLWQPFDDTLKKVEQFNVASKEIPIFVDTNITEFTRLNHSLEQLMIKDQQSYRIQKEFTENASHELQTPITIIRSKLDLLMQEKLTEKQMCLVFELYELTTRVGHLNRNLLLLAKIENAQYSTLEQVDIDSLISESLPIYETLQSNTTLKMEDQRKDHSKKLLANPVLLDCLLKNLIVNALRHSKPNGSIKIILEDHLLTVSNESDNGQELDDKTLFCRFHAGKTQAEGNGLGLAIVKAICDFHHWSIEYKFINGCHLFIVNFNIKQL